MNAAGEGRLAGIAKIFFVSPIFRQVSLRIEAADGISGDSGEAGVALLVEVYAAGRTDGPLGRFFQRGSEPFF